MSDIVERLRDMHPNFDEKPMCEEAAAEIERLRAQNAKLRAFLKDVSEDCAADVPPSYGAIKYGIRAALEEK